jgi:hypothetical protein
VGVSVGVGSVDANGAGAAAEVGVDATARSSCPAVSTRGDPRDQQDHEHAHRNEQAHRPT